MRTRHSPRAGFALAVAIFAIVVIGAIIAGVFFSATQQFRIGRNEILLSRATAAAEYGVNAAMVPQSAGGNWNMAWNGAAVGTTDSSTLVTLANGSTARVRVTRVGDANTPVFLIASEGRAGGNIGAQARRRTGTLVSLLRPELKMLAALTTHGSTQIGGSSFIDGMDTTSYNGWGCSGGPQTKPGIVTDNASQIQTSGCSSLSCIAGSPKILQDPAAADTLTYFDYGNGVDWKTLTSMATKSGYTGTINSVGPTYSGGACDIGNWYNWGAPVTAANPNPGSCKDYFPIIYAPGNLKITGGIGQGILLVNGNLSVQGGFEFYGPVIVRGDLDTQGTGGHFNGGVMAANVNLAQNTVLGNAVVTYSSCVLTRVLTMSTTPSRLATRPWAEMF
ncbi:MAG TPA: hypothetical protein VFS05_03670 [Gemmatimonadaceae bacterium]|nr:hypothetical protein [Gemmatimonadaceae bacterium]